MYTMYSSQKSRMSELMRELPAYVEKYIKHEKKKGLTAETLYNHVLTIRIFMHWISSYKEGYRNRPINEMPPDAFSVIDEQDIAKFAEYLVSYPDPTGATVPLKDAQGRKQYWMDGNKKRIKRVPKIWKNSPGSIRNKLSVLSGFFTYLNKTTTIRSNPARTYKYVPAVEPDIKPAIVMTPKETGRLIEDIQKGATAHTDRARRFHEVLYRRDLAILALILGVGLEPNELVHLDMDDIGTENGQTVLELHTKDAHLRKVYLPKPVEELFNEYLEGEPIPEAIAKGYSIKEVNDMLSFARMNMTSTDLLNRAKIHFTDVDDSKLHTLEALAASVRASGRNAFTPATKDAQQAVFLSIYGKRLGIKSYEGLVKKHIAGSAVSKSDRLKKLTPKQLRYTCANNLLREGVPEEVVRKVLNMEDLSRLPDAPTGTSSYGKTLSETPTILDG